MDERKINIFWQRGGLALVIWAVLTLASIFAEVWVGHRALLVSYNGKIYVPVLQGRIAGSEFGLGYDYEADYRELKKIIEEKEKNNKDIKNNFVILPLVPYSPTENALQVSQPNAWAPTPPSGKNWLGTDPLGRDILSRLVYGYRNALTFAGLYLLGLMIIGTVLGIAFGYYGGALDFWGQRLIEIWSNIPFIYVVMIVASITVPNLLWLVVLSLIFGWTGLASFVRTLSFRDKTREFVQAARASGASDRRIITRHLLPQLNTILLTFLPFQAVGAITTLTSLDFLGFGLRPPAPSWGELLRTGSSALQAPWIVLSVVVAMALILILLTVIGNALREAFDPKGLLRYK